MKWNDIKKPIYVFVYGSLKKNFHNNYVLQNALFVANDITNPNYTMVSLGSFPAVLEGGVNSIAGEIYKINDFILDDLDTLENYPDMYNRIQIKLMKFKHPVWMYVYNYNDEFYNNNIVNKGNIQRWTNPITRSFREDRED